ncbi:MAG: ATP-binding protein, partial [Bacteroidota bacterium]
SFHRLAEMKAIALVFQTSLREYIMDFDEEKIQQITYNLFSNALKFTEAGGTVFFRVKEVFENGGPRLELEIQDTGMGISAAALPHIFDRFYQADVDHSSHQRGGTGIGLALTKELVELMEGTITVKSELEKGTTFTILLPAISHAATLIKTNAGFNPKVPVYKEVSSHPSAKQEEWTNGKANSNQPLVLIVEDNADVTIYIESILKDQYQTRSATDGQLGIDMALALVPDLIITDVMMPKKDGIQLCEVLKVDERTSHIPIVMLTAKATQEDRLAGLKTGADAYLMKPFDKEELLVRLEKLIALRQALQKQNSRAIPSFLRKLSSSSETANDTTSLDEQFLKKITQIIEEKIGDAELNIAYLSAATHLSATQLNRKMKALTGEPPMSYIRKVRLHKAKMLLQSTDLSIAEIAYATGFTDPNYFSRAFNKEFLAPPSTVART